MKKLIFACVLMAIGASAQAVVTVDTADCIGQALSRTCTKAITCVGTCNTTHIPGELVDAICLPLGTEAAVSQLFADREGSDPSPNCSWDVTDTDDNSVTRVTINASDGLPVEVQSFSVE